MKTPTEIAARLCPPGTPPAVWADVKHAAELAYEEAGREMVERKLFNIQSGACFVLVQRAHAAEARLANMAKQAADNFEAAVEWRERAERAEATQGATG